MAAEGAAEPRRGWEGGKSREKIDKEGRNDKNKRGRRRSIETRPNRIQGMGEESVSKVRGWLVGDKEVEAVDNAADSRVESLNIATETSRGTRAMRPALYLSSACCFPWDL